MSDTTTGGGSSPSTVKPAFAKFIKGIETDAAEAINDVKSVVSEVESNPVLLAAAKEAESVGMGLLTKRFPNFSVQQLEGALNELAELWAPIAAAL